MQNVMRALVALVGLFGVVLAAMFFFDTAASGEKFFLRPVNIQGIATMRADMTAFFLVAGVCALIGAWKQRGDILLIPAALYSTAIVGRAASLAMDGALPSAYLPMGVEALLVGVCLLARRSFAR